ncbi:MAG: GHKL domain-containing protein [Limosilactobacillus oris]|uniref:sensor histidine kinase n=1 Tax=Megasphaera sp. TaxID=2023260 RepID=UPI0025C35895|nr:GHKL domain-containing protein [Megasphaera sp.]MCH3903865.1 GHKL domain-containing protein [Limosilactobacillus oris]MCH3931071.1 GHKL domain-containing protein [Megasphaera sp.]MCI1886956.1 GHKL domain-containing protein [Sporolactobacillus sp.]MCI1905003.1 GHKL domain-containing protein [Enterococcaceae bacterium]
MSHRSQEALQLIEEIGAELNQTKRKQYCQNPLVNAALSTYLAKAEALHMPITVKAVIPKENTALSSDLAIVLSNLIENAIHASEKQPGSHRALSLLTICQGDILSILVKNRFDGTVALDEDGLPTTKVKGHGIGMKSLSRFRDTYDASVLCTCEDGWFSTYIRVPWGKGSPS